MNNKAYWKQRGIALENLMQKNADQTIIKINKMYQQASDLMAKRINKIFTRYVTGGKINPEYARQLLNEQQTQEYRNKLKRLLAETKDEKLRREIINTLDAPAYANRISRFQALRDNLYYEARAIGAKEIELAERRIVNAYEQSYYRTMYADQKNSGLYDFDIITDEKIKKMLSHNWQSGNYSSRIWKNNQDFADKVAETIEIGCLAGQSLDEMCSELTGYVIGDTSDKAQRFVAGRLIRTEVNYFSNQGVLEGLKAAGFSKYRFIATLDIKTSKQCRSLDLKVFNIEDAVAGVNVPPLHPFCRSVIVPAYENENRAGRTRWARNPLTGKGMKVPADMNYDEWYKKYVLGNGLKDIADSGTINQKTIIPQSVINNIKSFDLPELTVKENKILHQAMGKVLNRVNGTPANTECAYYYDTHMNFLKWEMGMAGKGSVKVYRPPFDYIAIHNHPSGGTFSINDINEFALDSKMKNLIVVGNNGNQYVISKLQNFNSEKTMKGYLSYMKSLLSKNVPIDEAVKQCSKYLKTNGVNYGYRYQEITK